MAKLEKSGFKRYWPMRELMGHAADGTRVTREVFRNMETGKIHVPIDKKSGEFRGWSGEPVGAVPDQRVHSSTENYRARFELIKWNTPNA